MNRDEFTHALIDVTMAGQNFYSSIMRGLPLAEAEVKIKNTRAVVMAEFERLNAELALMTEDRDSETRWAKEYFDKWELVCTQRNEARAELTHWESGEEYQRMLKVAERDGLQAVTQYERAQKAENENARLATELEAARGEVERMQKTIDRFVDDADVLGPVSAWMDHSINLRAALEVKHV